MVGGLWGRGGCEGVYEIHGGEGITRAGKGDYAGFAPKENLKHHAVAAFSAHSFLLLKKSVSPKAYKNK